MTNDVLPYGLLRKAGAGLNCCLYCRHYDSTTNLLNRLNLPAPTRGTVVKVTSNGVPGAIGQRRRALLPGLQVARVNGTGQVRQGFDSGAKGENLVLDALQNAAVTRGLALIP